MAIQKPSIPKGTRDFLPVETARRNYIFDTIKDVYKLYGFLPIETPAMENLSTLMGKYGEEGDRLIFRILNSGDYLSDISDSELAEKNCLSLSGKICEKALRYDLTVPFARFVVQHRNDIAFPFKRYQIQPVWRADRPQKGRYREFFQCDADVVGSDSLLNEAELVQIIDTVFERLKVNVAVKINNRKILSGIAEIIGQEDKIIDITVAIDKLDKIGLAKVNEELASKGIPADAIDRLQPIIQLDGSNAEKLEKLKQVLTGSAAGMAGIAELETLFGYLSSFGIQARLDLDLTLARGLNYYTGAIFEVKALDTEMGSITGGGRYDNLTGIFGMPGVSGVGISFGADRIYDVLTQLNAFPAETASGTRVLFVNFGPAEEKYCLPMVAQLRRSGISAELFPDQDKMKKQMNYANQRQIPFVAIAGTDEMASGLISLKDMISGTQETLSIEQLIARVS